MKSVKFLIRICFQGIANILYSPLLIAYFTCADKSVIKADVKRWYVCNGWVSQQNDGESLTDFLCLAQKQAVFRNLLYFRAGNRNIASRLTVAICKFLYPTDPLLFIDSSCTIGEGLYIQHGFSTIINADLGKNCWINQQVTIGFKDAFGRPKLGDSVRISAGAKVLGAIDIGNNVIVGANAVVVKNVPPNSTVVGVPAYIIRQNGKPIKKKL